MPGGPNDYVYIYVTPANERQWIRLVETIGRPELSGDPRLASATARGQHREEVDELISAWTRDRSKHDVMEQLGRAGVPVSAVFDTNELLNDEDLRRRETVVTVDHPKRGAFVMPGWPVKLSGSHVDVEAAPLLGADNQAIFEGLLHMSTGEIEELREAGVI
jgi:formyl-CoA transferase